MSLFEDTLRLWFWHASCLKALSLLCLTEEPGTPVPWNCFRIIIDLCVPDLKECILRHRLKISDGLLIEVTTLCCCCLSHIPLPLQTSGGCVLRVFLGFRAESSTCDLSLFTLTRFSNRSVGTIRTATRSASARRVGRSDASNNMASSGIYL